MSQQDFDNIASIDKLTVEEAKEVLRTYTQPLTVEQLATLKHALKVIASASFLRIK